MIAERLSGHFRVLIEHSLRKREPTPEHVLERMVYPICEDIHYLLKNGTKNYSWEALERISKECKGLLL